MFWLNFKIALRNFLRNKGFGVINIAGLTIGLAATLLILLFVFNQMHFDRFHANFERIYQLQQTIYFEDEQYTTERAGGALGPEIASSFPEIDSYCRTGTFNNELLLSYVPPSGSPDRINLIEKKGLAVDSTFLRIFTFPLISGNPATVLKETYSIVLTKTMAKKYFAEADPLGNVMLLNDSIELLVTGVINDVPLNSNIQFDFLVPFDVLRSFPNFNDNFEGTHYITYFLLGKDSNASLLSDKIPGFLEKASKNPTLKVKPFLLHLGMVHLYDEKRSYIGVYTLTILAFLILLTACINFINLTTARAFDRAREVGIKKTEGAQRGQLIRQFLTETILITLVSLLFSIILVELALPYFRNVYPSVGVVKMFDPVFIMGMLFLVLITGLVAGIYPALVISSYHPIQILRNIRTTGKSGARLRTVLVVAQFSISIICIIGTVILVKQLHYMQNTDLGFNKNNILVIPARGEISKNIQVFKSQLLSSPDMISVCTSSDLPDNVMYGELRWGKPDNETNQTISRIMNVDYDFAQTFGIGMKEGRFFSREFSGDSSRVVVVNQAIADHLGYQDPVGKSFYFYDDEYTIIGVVNDFHFFPLNMGGKGLFMLLREKNQFVFVKYREGRLQESVDHITSIYSRLNPNYPVEYYLFDDYDRILFRLAKSSNAILVAITPLALIISCLGLIGLSIFTTEVKTKEIGIRKTFGASVVQILYGILKQFGLLVILSMAISMPLVYLLMDQVLNFFSKRIPINPWIFILTALGLLFLTMLTTGWQAYQASIKNPVKSLRYE